MDFQLSFNVGFSFFSLLKSKFSRREVQAEICVGAELCMDNSVILFIREFARLISFWDRDKVLGESLAGTENQMGPKPKS